MSNLDLRDLSSDKARVKYDCAKQAIAVSQNYPEDLYYDFVFFARLLDSYNCILKWTATKVIGNLSKIDNERKVDDILLSLIAFLSNKSMITAANAIGALSEIAKNKPEHRQKILKALLKVEKAKYYRKGCLSPECRNVVLGHVIRSFDKFGSQIYGREDVKAFLKRQTKNTRPKVRQLAEKSLKKIL